MAINKELKRSIETRNASVDVEARTAEFVISTEAIDSYQTVFKIEGWDLSRYQNNPIVLFNHNHEDVDHTIGTSEVRIEDGQLVAKVTFEDAESNPLAEKVFRKVQNGILRGASIRASVIDARMGAEDMGEDKDVLYFTRQELLEWSIVTINSNPEALARTEKTVHELRTALMDVEEDDVDPAESEEEKRVDEFDVFEAQLIVNQNLN